jgi:hypothetical protein
MDIFGACRANNVNHLIGLLNDDPSLAFHQADDDGTPLHRACEQNKNEH